MFNTQEEDKQSSLVQKKKQQWAKEKEELSGLYFPWNTNVQIWTARSEEKCERMNLPPLINLSRPMSKETSGATSGYGSDTATINSAIPCINCGYDFAHNPKNPAESCSRWKDQNWMAPTWVRRHLDANEKGDNLNTTLVESTNSTSSSELSKPPTSSSSSSHLKTHIRGQNAPIDTIELIEREKRRQMALAHQNAIKQQLIENEIKKKEDRARKLLEEQDEKLRIERELQIEQKRREDELKVIKEKKTREYTFQKSSCNVEKQTENSTKTDNRNNEKLAVEYNNKVATNVTSLQNENSLNQEDKSKQSKLDDKNEEGNTLNNDHLNTSSASLSNEEKNESTKEIKIDLEKKKEVHDVKSVFPLPALSSLQYAVLVPIAPRTENRVLTPTQYRVKQKLMYDASTQTDVYNLADDESQMKMEKLEKRKLRKNRRSSLDARPKWGVNRPPTRYLKQSEKDLLYQRRKCHQKYGENEVQHFRASSDESLIGSPKSCRKDHKFKRHSRPLWRKCDRFYERNIRMCQTEIIPLNINNHSYCKYHCECCCLCSYNNHEVTNDNRNVNTCFLPHYAEHLQSATDILEKLNFVSKRNSQKQNVYSEPFRTRSASLSELKVL